jgi:hypothetical protein
MADKTFNILTGAVTWNTAGNWTPSGVPATGDRVFLPSGNAVITAGSTQAAVALAELVALDTFTGSLVIDVNATLVRVGAPSGSTSGNGGSGKFVLSPSAASTVLVYKTASSTDATSGYGAFRFNGTAAGNAVYVQSGSVEVGSDLAAAKVDTLDVQAGTVVVRQAATTKAMTQSGGEIRHAGLWDAAASVVQTGGTLYTSGTTAAQSFVIGGTAYLNHRNTGGNDATAVEVLNGGTLNTQGDPRSFDTSSAVTLRKGATLKAFSAAQITAGVTFPNGSSFTIG